MSIGQDYGEEARNALLGAFIALYVSLLVPPLKEVAAITGAEKSVTFPLFVLQISPDIFTFVGLILSLAVAGPFGLLGWGLETSGVNAIVAMTDMQAAIWRVLIGAGITTVGAVIWKWRYAIAFLEWLLSNGSRHSRR